MWFLMVGFNFHDSSLWLTLHVTFPWPVHQSRSSTFSSDLEAIEKWSAHDFVVPRRRTAQTMKMCQEHRKWSITYWNNWNISNWNPDRKNPGTESRTAFRIDFLKIVWSKLRWSLFIVLPEPVHSNKDDVPCYIEPGRTWCSDLYICAVQLKTPSLCSSKFALLNLPLHDSDLMHPGGCVRISRIWVVTMLPNTPLIANPWKSKGQELDHRWPKPYQKSRLLYIKQLSQKNLGPCWHSDFNFLQTSRTL